MQDNFNRPYDSKLVEGKIYKLWEKSGYFTPEAHQPRAGNPKSRKTFSIVVPPPNITGSLHMGHALNATIQDILIRQKRMEGYKTLWLPGTDHAGIATQNVVEKELKKQNITRHELGREKFLEKIWQWKEKYGHIILDQLKKLGASMDWSRTRFTMDDEYQASVKEAFLHYYKKGWIYQAERVINWCVRCATSLSDLELEYKEEQAMLSYIKYPLVGGKGFITIATTRPETMLGDAAVAVNPKDKRYENLIGKKARLPIKNREIPIIADKMIDAQFGTGAVKVTPAHDLTDADIAQRHQLPIYKIIGTNGRMTNEAGKICEGLKISECRNKVIEELKKQNLLIKQEPYTHNVARCYRCNTIIEPMPSLQWFLKMDELAKIATKAVKSGKIKFHPKHWEKFYFNWLNNIKDWCISRQIWWGHQLPVWQCKCQTGSNSEFRIQNSKLTHQEFIISNIKPKQKCNLCNSEYRQIPDVLDTWFSSALWPFATLGWPSACERNQKSPPEADPPSAEKIKNQKCKAAQKSDLAQFYPTQVLSTARDIINLWVSRMIFSGLEFINQEPFRDIIIHATILTKDGKRMSKSLGTGVDPMDLINQYGADATRFGLIWQAMGGQDIHWSEEHVVAGRKFCNKIWNAARFVLQNTNSKLKIQNSKSQFKNKKLTKADKQILSKLAKTKKIVEKDLENYRFGPPLHKIYHFFWHEFCDKYIETSKKQLATNDLQITTQRILLYALIESLKLLHPFMPFITEEIYQNLPIRNKKLLIIEQW